MTAPHDTFNDASQTPPKYGALISAASKGDAEPVKSLLAAGADVNETIDTNSFTAVMIAAFCGRAEVTRVLIDAGANLEEKDKAGYTATVWAEKNGHPDIAEMLKEAISLRQQQSEKNRRAATAAEIERAVRAATGPLQQDMPAPKTIRFGKN